MKPHSPIPRNFLLLGLSQYREEADTTDLSHNLRALKKHSCILNLGLLQKFLLKTLSPVPAMWLLLKLAIHVAKAALKALVSVPNTLSQVARPDDHGLVQAVSICLPIVGSLRCLKLRQLGGYNWEACLGIADFRGEL